MQAQDQLGLWASLRKLYAFMSRERRRHFHLVIALMIVGAFAELATIGAVLPFLALLADPSRLDFVPVLRDLFDAVGASSPRERLVAASALFVALAIIAGLIRL